MAISMCVMSVMLVCKSFELMFTACALHVHCMCTACALLCTLRLMFFVVYFDLVIIGFVIMVTYLPTTVLLDVQHHFA